VRNVTHPEYNAFLQSVQEDALVWGFETRIQPVGSRANFEVYFDGRWQTLASETPFVSDRNAWIDEEKWLLIQSRAAASL
jgi:hypothetical protein